MHNVTMLSVIMLSVMLKECCFKLTLQSAAMLNVVMPSLITLSVNLAYYA
jgi:hypothetical protein